MNKIALKRLKQSIVKWKRLADGKPKPTQTIGIQSCPLCSEFFHRKDETFLNCAGCPVRERTGQRFCAKTPYDAVFFALRDFQAVHRGSTEGFLRSRRFQKIARRELEFLVSLLPNSKETK